jgi:hypothetical protein
MVAAIFTVPMLTLLRQSPTDFPFVFSMSINLPAHQKLKDAEPAHQFIWIETLTTTKWRLAQARLPS